MIELKNINKTYKSKKGTDTVALKDVNISLPDTGLVFILGKSGSGKSTLLNILGGLDSSTSGEIIINGKSNNDFKESDYDAYRNTYVGFIFQEYNLLENYTIEQNIKLSLELQHKKVTDNEVTSVLKQVGLDDVKRRKTNELSGGQKQRIAIARALIKNPAIILADEPTGNLDSSTSKQIFELLKKLSKDKLIVVVSHDEEAAKKYSDEIINIKDGVVTSKIKKPKEIKGSLELINAHLPLFYSLKMGISNLFQKKFRLFISGVLIIFSLICFGLMTSVYTSDVKKQSIDLFKQKGETRVSIWKYDKEINYNDEMKKYFELYSDYSEEKELETIEGSTAENLDENFLNEVNNATNLDFSMLYTISSSGSLEGLNLASSLMDETSLPIYYYQADFGLSDFGFTTIEGKTYDKIIGKIPENDDEALVSSYVADAIIYFGVMLNDGEKYKPSSYNELVNDGKLIEFGSGNLLKISGIIDDTNMYADFTNLKNVTYLQYDFSSSHDDYDRLFDLINTYGTTIHVKKSFIEQKQSEKNTLTSKYSRYIVDDKLNLAKRFGYIDESTEVYTDVGAITIDKLNDDEVVIDESILNILSNFSYIQNYQNNSNKYSNKEEYVKDYLKENNIIGNTLKSSINNNTIEKDENNYKEYKIVGVLLTDEVNPTVYYSYNVVKDIMENKVQCYSLYRDVENVDEYEKILGIYPVDKAKVIASSKYSEIALSSSMITYLFQYVSKYAIIFFLLFASLILMSFINTSITTRKKEVGILRALGCRSKDIISMFIYEGLMLMIIALLVSFAVIPNMVTSLNDYLCQELGAKITMLNFTAIQALEISGLMIIIVILANIIPVRKITKMKPVDTIANK